MTARFGRNKARRAREALAAERRTSADLIERMRATSLRCAELTREVAEARQVLARHCSPFDAFAIGIAPENCRDRVPLANMLARALPEPQPATTERPAP